MKPTALGLLIAAAAFGASTLYLSVQLRDERAQSDKLIAETRALNERIAALELARTEQRFAAVTPFGASMMPPGPRPGYSARAEDAEEDEVTGLQEVPLNGPSPNQEAFQKMMRAQIRTHTKLRYADIGTRLGLSKEDTSKLIDLLTEQQIEGVTTSREAPSIEDTMRLMQEKQLQDKAKIAELLGPDKAESFEEFQQSLPARQELEMLARQFDGADTPLNAEQQKRLLAIMIDERKRVPAPSATDVKSYENYAAAYMKWEADYEESVASQARAILNPEQLASYNEYREWQQQMTSMAVAGPARIRRMPGGPNITFTGATPIMGADVAIAVPVDEAKPRN